MREAITLCEELSGKSINWSYVDDSRIGDHIWWFSDVRRFRSDYPEWHFTYDNRRPVSALLPRHPLRRVRGLKEFRIGRISAAQY
jgi:CDP-paratose 2-epimerase